MTDEFRMAVNSAATRADVLDAVQRVYADLAAEIERRRPVCVASGQCCRFEESGHRLFITTMEMAVFVRQIRQRTAVGCGKPRRQAQPIAGQAPSYACTGCTFQIGRLCGVHAIRPFGCRIFFCDATAQEWQREQYRIFHERLRKLHEEMNVPYFYMEWRAALIAVL